MENTLDVSWIPRLRENALEMSCMLIEVQCDDYDAGGRCRGCKHREEYDEKAKLETAIVCSRSAGHHFLHAR